ncbi:SARP family transcriptional regulator [Phytohabitans suffuscus]|uniref:SARP family transcriptional regulator n=1 Tax=Phytohabitans suffuscus TaxID=624315 RepID=A0A6F8YDW6_9ACTN|nr:SARP family transcriptional regulator [Phytohabitans suffuscus]
MLGPVDVFVDGVARPVSGARRKAVLAVLALAGGDLVPADRLIEMVWGDEPPATALNTLQSHISYLRRLLGGRSGIVARPPGYLLSDELAATDLQVAVDLINRGRQSDNPATAVSHLAAAVALWRGHPLADVSESAGLEAQAQRLRTLQQEAVFALIDARLALGEHDLLIPDLDHLVRQHPFHEGFHGQLMLTLYRVGRQADALATFNRLRRTLDEELGIAPGYAVRQLEAAILRQDPALARAARGSTVAVAPDARTNGRVNGAAGRGRPLSAPRQLPAGVAGFTGRAVQLYELDEALNGAAPHLAPAVCVISGTAGLGKTTLALHWAQRVASQFPDGQLYLNLRGFDPNSPPLRQQETVRALLEALAVRPEQIPSSVDAQVALYRGLLAERRVLVVLDNARDADQVRPLLPGAPPCVAVVTSRDQLAGLVATHGARPVMLDLLSRDEARRMLEHRLGGARVAAEPDAVDEIITRCAGLPLALAVISARAATNPRAALRALAADLGDAAGGLDALAGGDAAADVRTVFACSYRQLSPPAARLFRLLGLTPTPAISTAAAASLAGVGVREVRRIMTELVGAHLVVEQAPGRYTLHDLLRAYAGELVRGHDTEPSRQAATGRLFDHYLHTAHAAARLLNPHRYAITLAAVGPGVTTDGLADHNQALEWLGAERPALLAALHRAAGSGGDRHAWQLAWTLGDVLDRQGRWHDLVEAAHAAFAAAQRLADPAAQALAHRLLVLGLSRLERLAEAHAHGQQALELYRRSGDRQGQAHAHRALTRVLERLGRHAEALDHARCALDLYRASGLRDGQATALNSVGWFLALLGDHRGALSACTEALRLQQELGDHFGQAASWDSLGYANHHLGRHDAAVDCYRRAIDLFRDLGDRYNEADCLAHLAETQDAIGDPDAAQLAWTRALRILDDLGHPDAEQVRLRLTRARLPSGGRARAVGPARHPSGQPAGLTT